MRRRKLDAENGHMFQSARPDPDADLRGMLLVLGKVDANMSDAERVDQLAALEQLKSAVAAAQARITVDFVESQEQVARQWRQRARECADDNDFEGWRAARERTARRSRRRRPSAPPEWPAAWEPAPRCRAGRGRTGGVGASGVSVARVPAGGGALTLVREMPHTMAALQDGTLTDWRGPSGHAGRSPS